MSMRNSLFLLAIAVPLSAGTYTAADCNRSTVNALINGPGEDATHHVAVDGDVINIPAGSCTWTSGITVPSNIGITIAGAGTPNTAANQTGAGTVTTNITNNLSSGSLLTLSPQYGNSLTRISSIKFIPTIPSGGYTTPMNISGTCTSSGCPNVRLDNLILPTSWESAGLPDGSFAFVANVFGVADHNTIGDTNPSVAYVNFVNIGHGSWKGVGNWGDNSWASADTFGTNQMFYLENNSFNYSLATDTDISGSTGGGARLACRFNDWPQLNVNGGCTGHGTDTTGRSRGVRQWEGYYNTATCTNTSQGCGSLWPGRSGVGRSFSNTIVNSGGGFAKGLADLDAQRTWRPDSPWGGCNGTSAWDVNDGTTYYTGTIASIGGVGTGSITITASGSPGWTTNQWAPSGAPYSFVDAARGSGIQITSNTASVLSLQFICESCITMPQAGDSFTIQRATVCMDQPTRSGGELVHDVTGNPVLVSTGNPGSVAQSLDPTYEAGDSLPGTASHTIGGSSGQIIGDRDYYVESVNQTAQTSATSPFNGTSGSGHGTLARRPTTCTTGVGYWATDQGSWNTSAVGGQGLLYTCTSTNTWSLSYTPYTYPHPLVSGASPTPVGSAFSLKNSIAGPSVMK